MDDDSAKIGVDLGSPQGFADLFRRVSRGQLVHCLKSIDGKIGKGMRKEDAWYVKTGLIQLS